MYEKELMMAIVGSATALAGLQGVVIGQITQNMNVSAKFKRALKILLVGTFLFAIISVVSAMDWLLSPEIVDKWIAIITFSLQLTLFSVIVSAYWIKG